MNIQQAERNRAGVRRWYGNNRDEYNAKRREEYANNPEAREKARIRAAGRRQAQHDGVVTVPTRVLYRDVNGRQMRVYSTGQVAAMMARSAQMLRNWENGGLIPLSTFPDTHRLYTKGQATKLVALADVMKRTGGGWDHPKVIRKSASIFRTW